MIHLSIVMRLAVGLALLGSPGDSDPTSSAGWFPELFDLDSLTHELSGKVRVLEGSSQGDEAPFVLFRSRGPAVLARLWIEDPSRAGNIRFLIDGNSTPAISLDAARLFSGKSFPFLAPFTSGGKQTGRGGELIFPISFRQGIRVETDGKVESFFAHLRDLSPGEIPLSFQRSLLDFHAGKVLDAADRLNSKQIGKGPGGENLDDLTLPRTEGRGPSGLKPHEIEPGDEKVVYQWRGAGVIRKILLRLRGSDEPLRTVSIRIHWDGWFDPCVSCPVGDFFLSGARKTDGGGLIAGYREGSDVYYCRWPMPFRTGAEIRLVNDGEHSVSVDVAVETGINDDALDRDLYFHSGFSLVDTSKAEADLLTFRGAGHYVGASVTRVENDGEDGWTGRFEVVADGNSFSFDGLLGPGSSFSLPFSGVPLRGEFGASRAVSSYRHLLTDRIPFARTLRLTAFRDENTDGGSSQVGVCHYWYARGLLNLESSEQRIGFRDLEFATLPPVESRRCNLRSDSDSERVRRQGIEAQDLPIVAISGGGAGRELAFLSNHGLSGDDYFLFRATKAGSFVEVDLAFKKKGDYRFEVWPVRGPKMGVWSLSVDGEAFSESYDGYTEVLEAPERVVFGVRTLAVGPHKLRFTTVSKNEASGGSMIGVDLVTIVPVARSKAR